MNSDSDSEIEIVKPNNPSQQQLKPAQSRFSSPKLPLSRSPSRPRLSQSSVRLAFVTCLAQIVLQSFLIRVPFLIFPVKRLLSF
ncbi:hypothetical protein CROQUDRAFT_650673 [Cronartium quercuum f. sp. fusiforme G11]|uniref:Uncharacterized protein n=1 Tax=Cronartium quercuum f. sp. fusiforme G11 TaxID=708437 RepID=A0A9P6TGR6_9BASI|nr:hypothetical protein CROQUDRAFT_650673 [Cronartium quercuum f. sp. fusiforme G11]